MWEVRTRVIRNYDKLLWQRTGLQMCYIENFKVQLKFELEQITKNFSQAIDYFLQLENMKAELLVIASQENCGEYCVRLITQCPPMTESKGFVSKLLLDLKFYTNGMIEKRLL